ncbi:hypothetical protein [Shewanella sp.]|uniref:hypothetical protein n=1 Tax=Shewanella sp. TaxID=50422 RepID=UPI00258E5576|nr:hypothetical protein [Shewanella sp.]MCJ8301521.1 hypothetical protein [Shewanella sp.]
MKFKIVIPICIFTFLLGLFTGPFISHKEVEEVNATLKIMREFNEELSIKFAVLKEREEYSAQKAKIETMGLFISFNKRNDPPEYVIEELNSSLIRSIKILSELNKEAYPDSQSLIEQAEELQDDIRFYY